MLKVVLTTIINKDSYAYALMTFRQVKTSLDDKLTYTHGYVYTMANVERCILKVNMGVSFYCVKIGIEPVGRA